MGKRQGFGRVAVVSIGIDAVGHEVANHSVLNAFFDSLWQILEHHVSNRQDGFLPVFWQARNVLFYRGEFAWHSIISWTDVLIV